MRLFIREKLGVILAAGIVLCGCQSAKQLEASFNENYLQDSADLTFSSPNFSAPNVPPLIVGYAYVETYEKNDFCAGSSKLIGKAVVTRSQKTSSSKLPAGNIVANIGYYAVGSGGLRGNLYYGFKVKPGSKYKITLTESRPLVTSYTVKVEEIGATSEIHFVNGKTNICK